MYAAVFVFGMAISDLNVVIWPVIITWLRNSLGKLQSHWLKLQFTLVTKMTLANVEKLSS